MWWGRPLVPMAALWLSATASAHPMSRTDYSLRAAVEVSDDRLQAIVVMEVPFDVVAADLRDGMAAARTSADATHAAAGVLDAYTHGHWETMAAGLRLRVNGALVAGVWKPKENRLNGKGAVTGGFFLYMVEFVPAQPVVLGRDVDVVIENVGYADKPMVYSAMVVAGTGWRVVLDSSRLSLPSAPYNVDDGKFWSRDVALRRLEARYVATP